MIEQLTPEIVAGMPYPDFVGLVNQWNVLPGAYNTISKWAVYGKVDASSNILQVACTTGFQSRELAVLTGCRGSAFDLSRDAIEAAIWNRDNYAPNTDINYFVANVHDYKPDQKFTHILVGAGIGFIANPEAAVLRMTGWFDDLGYVLASPFWITSPVPENLIKCAQKVFGITPTTAGYKEVMRLYKDFEILYEDKVTIEPETDIELTEYSTSTINRVSCYKKITDSKILDAMYDRLMTVRRTSNALRQYQQYSTLVLRYRRTNYPHRYVELF